MLKITFVSFACMGPAIETAAIKKAFYFFVRSRRVHETRNGTRTGSAETACLEPNQDEVSYAGSKREYKPSLVKAMVRVYGPYFGVAVFFKLINDSLLFVQPYLLRYK